jgi:hypothetical protein
MTMENSGDKEARQMPDPKQSMTHTQVPNPSRRRFNRAGVGASAVILTLASRSVLAESVCKSPSGFISANQSAHGTEQPQCNGYTPEIWLQKELPILKTTSFVSVFGTFMQQIVVGQPLVASAQSTAGKSTESGAQSWLNSNLNGKSSSSSNGGARATANSSTSTSQPDLLLADATFYQALAGDKTPSVVKHLIAAYVNFTQGLNAFPTDVNAVQIFREWESTGSYVPSAGVRWSDAKIVEYLRATQTDV